MSFNGRRLAGLAFLIAGATAQASFTPGTGIKAGTFRVSPFAEAAIGYDSNVRLAEGNVLRLQSDGSYQVQDSKLDDYFSQLTVGVGASRVLVSEWDLRFRGWYDARVYAEETDINYDSVSVEGSARYWPISDYYSATLGGKYRVAQDVERVPASASLTMPGEVELPYLEERDDRLKRTTVDGFGRIEMRPRERLNFAVGGTGSMVDYDDADLFDYWQWALNGEAGYRYTEKTIFFGELECELVDGDALSDNVPVYALRIGFRTKPRTKVDYKIGVGVKTYEYFTDETGDERDRKWDPDFDGQLNWHYSEKLNVFGKVWTDVGTSIQNQSPENTRRTYAGKIGADYAFWTRLNAVGAVTYRLDDYDFPIEYDDDQVQKQTELWQVMGRLTLAPRANTFWKVFTEVSYEFGDNDLDTYDQWVVWMGGSVWY